MWVYVNQRKPEPFARVWVKTDTGRQTTGYVDTGGEWIINCPSIRDTGATVVQWRE